MAAHKRRVAGEWIWVWFERFGVFFAKTLKHIFFNFLFFVFFSIERDLSEFIWKQSPF